MWVLFDSGIGYLCQDSYGELSTGPSKDPVHDSNVLRFISKERALLFANSNIVDNRLLPLLL